MRKSQVLREKRRKMKERWRERAEVEAREFYRRNSHVKSTGYHTNFADSYPETATQGILVDRPPRGRSERLIYKYVNNALLWGISHAAWVQPVAANLWQGPGRPASLWSSIMAFLAANLSSRFQPRGTRYPRNFCCSYKQQKNKTRLPEKFIDSPRNALT